jgi:hypothetical protein
VLDIDIIVTVDKVAIERQEIVRKQAFRDVLLLISLTRFTI